MSLDKSEIKIGTVHELGCRLDDMFEAAQKDVLRMEGATQAFQKAEESVQALGPLADKEMDEGKFDLEQAKHIKRYLERALQILTNLKIQAQNSRIMQMGRAQGMEAAVAAARKLKTEEEGKRAAMLSALKSGTARQEDTDVAAVEGVPSLVGMRPGSTIKAQRQAEDATAQSSEVPLSPPIKRKPGRPRKA